MKRFFNNGFTLVEILLVIGIVGVIVGLAIPFYQNYQISTQLDTNSFQLVQTLRKAQALAMASQDYQTFGVHFEPRKFVLFKGSVYNVSDQNNEVYELPSSLSLITNSPQILFSQVKGLPTLSGPSPVPTTTLLSVTLRSNNNQVKIVNVNEAGKVDLL